MGKVNDLNLENWKEDCKDIYSDSLWIINSRDNSGKHSNFYHGNFVPQIPFQLINKYTKKGDIVLDMFIGSGTTAIEAEKLGRYTIGIDLNSDLIDRITDLIDDKKLSKFIAGDSTDKKTFSEVENFLKIHGKTKVDMVILHPPYFDILKFSGNKNDLSNSKDLNDFLEKFEKIVLNAKNMLKKGGYLALVIGDKYQNGEWIPLGFYSMYKAQKLGLKLKSIIVKNMEGNRGKLGSGGIWRYRSLASDYYIFKHEYVFILQN